MELPRTKIAVFAFFSIATGSRASAARLDRAFFGLAGAIIGVAEVDMLARDEERKKFIFTFLVRRVKF